MNHSMNACRIKFRLITGISIYLAFLSQFALSPTLNAADLASLGGIPKSTPSAFLTNSGGTKGSALDANGVRHHGVDYARKRPPWLLDTTKAIAPDYPDRDRIQGHQGAGMFQLNLDLKTGLVTRVTMIKSTGFPALDTSAVASLRQWRWKPGKWKEIEMAVAFTRP